MLWDQTATAKRGVKTRQDFVGGLTRGRRDYSGYYRAIARTSIPLAIGDLVSAYLGIAFGWMAVAFLWDVNILGHDRLFIFLPFAVLVSLLLSRSYPLSGVNPIFEFYRVVGGMAHAFLLVTGFCLAHYQEGVFVSVVVITFVGFPTLVFGACGRHLTRRFMSRYAWWGIPVFFVGEDKSTLEMIEYVKRNPIQGFRVQGVFDNDLRKKLPDSGEYVRADGGDLCTTAEELNVFCAVVGEVRSPQETSDLMGIFPSLYFTTSAEGMQSLWKDSLEIAGVSCHHIQTKLYLPWHKVCKRLMDVVLSVSALVLFSPVCLIIAVVAAISRDRPLYAQRRIGRGGKSFLAWKFRTMVENAEEILDEFLLRNSEMRAEWYRDKKLRNDPRVTKFGDFLRKTSLDEVPQLWNIVRGEMSLVGPRPVPVYELQEYRSVSKSAFEAYKRVRPGLTGLWQVSGRNNTTYEERVRWDQYYVANWSVWLDLYIVLRTFKTVLFREGAR